MRTQLFLLMTLFACQGATETEANEPSATENEVAADAPATEGEPMKAATDWTHYGEAFTQETVITSDTFLADPSPHVDSVVRISGRLADVCQKAGCWMVLTDDAGNSVRVTTGHNFLIAKDTMGRMAEIQGQVHRKEVKQETVDHYASERTSADAVIPEEGKSETFEVVATGVSISPKAV
jgi:hypothetical protein